MPIVASWLIWKATMRPSEKIFNGISDAASYALHPIGYGTLRVLSLCCPIQTERPLRHQQLSSA